MLMNPLFLKKRTLGTALLTLGLLGGSGCTKDYLALQPRNAASTETFYANQTDAIQATNAAYAQLQQAGVVNHALWMMDIMADNSFVGGGGAADGIEFQQLDNYTIPPSNPVITEHFQRVYIGIGAANQVLLHVPNIAMDEAIKKRSLGEAQFLRALYYFYLVRAYGDVPLVLTPATSPAEAASVIRDPAAKVYAQIITDLTEAIKNLPLPSTYTGGDVGRASKLSAMGILSKVYLTQGDMTNAAAQADATIAAALADGKMLWANYGDNFKLENENGQESLFEVQFKSGLNGYILDGPGSAINEFWGARFFTDNSTPELAAKGYVVSSGGYGFNIPEKEFVDGYEAGDLRKGPTVFVPGDKYPEGQTQPAKLEGDPNGYNVRKFFVGNLSTIWDSPLNVPIMRLSEVYLIKAEAANSLDALNVVRKRAGLPAATTIDQSVVLKERRYELAFEMDRWYDLKRTKTLTNNPNLLAKGIKPFNDLLPIPQAERDVNPKLTQNPGY